MNSSSASPSSAEPSTNFGLVTGSTIDGVELRELEMHHDTRGSFTEVLADLS